MVKNSEGMRYGAGTLICAKTARWSEGQSRLGNRGMDWSMRSDVRFSSSWLLMASAAGGAGWTWEETSAQPAVRTRSFGAKTKPPFLTAPFLPVCGGTEALFGWPWKTVRSLYVVAWPRCASNMPSLSISASKVATSLGFSTLVSDKITHGRCCAPALFTDATRLPKYSAKRSAQPACSFAWTAKTETSPTCKHIVLQRVVSIAFGAALAAFASRCTSSGRQCATSRKDMVPASPGDLKARRLQPSARSKIRGAFESRQRIRSSASLL
mmetsp:Transcript_19210/g.64895  ORF Transcript_19210/g.64895 Transcript_19210/m.64895 type:complete len:268 (+) Transcript_19210:227-1030(+)